MPNKNEQHVNAGFFVRLAAFLIDSILIALISLGLRFPLWLLDMILPNSLLSRDFIFQYSITDLIFVILQASYFILLTYASGQTVGKKLMHLKVVSVQGCKLTLWEVVIRETVGRFLSALVLQAGYLAVGVRKDKRGLHDWFADSKVIYYHVQERPSPVTVTYKEPDVVKAYSPAEYYKPVVDVTEESHLDNS